MFDCHFPSRYDRKKRSKKRQGLAYRFETTMELGDTSDEEASPERPKKRELSKSTRIQMVTMLQTLKTDDGMRSGSFAMVAECFGVARSTVYRLWNRVVRTRTHGHILSPEFQSHKKLRETTYVSIGVRLRGNKEHPITEATNTKKAGSIVWGVKDDCATLDC